MRSQVFAFVVLTLLGVVPAQAGYSVDVNTVPDFLKSAGTIAVLPPICPADVDCVWLTKKVEDELTPYKHLKVVGPEKVGQAMFGLGIEQVGERERAPLARKVGADSLLVILVGHSDTVTKGHTLYSTGNFMWASAPARYAKGGLEVSLVSAETGKVLMKGKGFGETGMRKQKGVLRKIFQKIIKEAFGKPE